MQFVLESKINTLESDCLLEIVFSNIAICPGVKDGNFGELLRPGGRTSNKSHLDFEQVLCP
jgi:hypothetical protein